MVREEEEEGNGTKRRIEKVKGGEMKLNERNRKGRE